jgi:hypothetical protein
VALHYDFTTRSCKAYPLVAMPRPLGLLYLRRSHTVVYLADTGGFGVNLSSGSTLMSTVATSLWARCKDVERVAVSATVPLAMPDTLLEKVDIRGGWPSLWFEPVAGRLAVRDVLPAWEEFTPRSDGKPVLAGCELREAALQGQTLAAVFVGRPGNNVFLHVFRGPHGVPLVSYRHPSPRLLFALSPNGRLLARRSHPAQISVHDVLSGGPAVCFTRVGRFHSRVEVELGEGWLAMGTGEFTCVVRWGHGPLQVTPGRGKLDTVLQGEALSRCMPEPPGCRAFKHRVPAWLQPYAGRWRAAAWGHLVAAVDRFGHVALFRHDGTLVCLFFAFRRRIAAWMPDGTGWGAEALLERPATPAAADRIAQALREAEAAGRGR